METHFTEVLNFYRIKSELKNIQLQNIIIKMGPKHSKESQEGDSSPRSADDSRDPRSGDADSGLKVPK